MTQTSINRDITSLKSKNGSALLVNLPLFLYTQVFRCVYFLVFVVLICSKTSFAELDGDETFIVSMIPRLRYFPSRFQSYKRNISQRHFIREPSCSFEGDVTTG